MHELQQSMVFKKEREFLGVFSAQKLQLSVFEIPSDGARPTALLSPCQACSQGFLKPKIELLVQKDPVALGFPILACLGLQRIIRLQPQY